MSYKIDENAPHLRNDVKMQEMALQRTQICKIFWEGMHEDPPRGSFLRNSCKRLLL